MNLAPLWSNFRFKTGIGEKILDIFQYYVKYIICVDLLLKSNNIKSV